LRSILVSIALFAVASATSALGATFAPTASVPSASGGPSASASPALPRLPACSYDDIATPLAGYDDWALTLIDTYYALPKGYEPPDLVDASAGGLPGGQQVRALMIPDLKTLTAAAGEAGVNLAILSGYRSYRTQGATFQKWVGVLGPDKALLGSARAGHSEHQLGLAIDFKTEGSDDPWALRDWSKLTKEGKWLTAHAWEFGFVLSYPANHKSPAKTCYGYEPWHYRWVGRVEAAAVRDSGLTLREWLWQRQPR
jgi:D-alanyl-D-alanine carboxypeptidase